MGKGMVRQLRFESWRDPGTGARVTRLTPPHITCHRNYFYQKCFTNDGAHLIFGAEFGPGPHWNYHLLDLAAQTATQLTEGADENTFGGFLSPDDQHLYFVRADRQLICLSLADLHEEAVYTVPAGWVGYGTWVANSACTRMVGIEIAADDWFALTDWRKFAEMFHARPRCRLIRIDLTSGQRELILEQRGWLGHPQYRPGDDNIVAYCHEGPHDQIDARIWFIDENGSNRRCAKVQAPGEYCTHEFWVPDGSAMVYVSFFKDQARRQIHSLDPLTLRSRLLTDMPPCSHLMSNPDGTLIVGDGCGTLDGGAATDPYLHLFNLRDVGQNVGQDVSRHGIRQVSQRIAQHGTSWAVYKGNRQVTHPHPSFTPDQRAVLFTSDVAGEPGLFIAELPAAGLHTVHTAELPTA